jgi:hypothetical protein
MMGTGKANKLVDLIVQAAGNAETVETRANGYSSMQVPLRAVLAVTIAFPLIFAANERQHGSPERDGLDSRVAEVPDPTRLTVDPYSIIVAALVAGANASVKSIASSRARDLYTRLQRTLIRRLGDEQLGTALFAELERRPESADMLFLQQFRTRPDIIDEEVLDCSRALIETLQEPGADPSKYTVEARNSRGVQIGDHNTQVNTFSIGDSGVRNN